MSKPFDVKTEIKLRPEAVQELRAAVQAGVSDIFEKDIKPAAAWYSPYLTGHNRRSIDTDVHLVGGFIVARLYTQSGYGGYLELGTSRMGARPFLWPAFQLFAKDIARRCGQQIGQIKNNVEAP